MLDLKDVAFWPGALISIQARNFMSWEEGLNVLDYYTQKILERIKRK
jgi:hypothetical protein